MVAKNAFANATDPNRTTSFFSLVFFSGPSQVSTFEARKAKRHARQVALAKLLKAKPAEDADDPR